jgi:hypothetical protein
MRELLEAAARHEREVEAKESAWLTRNKGNRTAVQVTRPGG